MQDFLGKTHSIRFIFYTLAPAPDDYFFTHFSKYSVARVPVSTPYDDYIEFLHRDPGSSPADALLHNAEILGNLYGV